MLASYACETGERECVCVCGECLLRLLGWASFRAGKADEKLMEKIGMCGLSIYKPFGKTGGEENFGFLTGSRPVNRGVIGGLQPLRQVILVLTDHDPSAV
jgi:hypothetical protein